MSTGPPITPPATYPHDIKVFVTYTDQPPPHTPPDTSVIWSYIVDEIHGEILAVEHTMGATPWTAPGQTTLSGSMTAIYQGKAPRTHLHTHGSLTGDSAGDDHPRYVRTDGARGFANPVTSPPAWEGHQLMRLDQAQGIGGLTAAAMNNLLQAILAPLHPVSGGFPVSPQWGPPPGQGWKLIGGANVGYTDQNGYLFINFEPAFATTVISFTFMRLPVPGRSRLGYTYQYMEDQLILKQISPAGATVQFIEDIVIDRRAWCCMSWLAVGY
jgi:hypothetical protein